MFDFFMENLESNHKRAIFLSRKGHQKEEEVLEMYRLLR